MVVTAPSGSDAPHASMPRTGPATIEADGVSKAFGDKTVVDQVRFDVGLGEVFGLIGPSGSGKSTLIRLMVGQALPTGGSVRVLGAEPRNFGTVHREAIGYVPQGFLLYPTLTVEENAKFVAGLYGMGWRHRRHRIRETLTMLELWDARGRRASQISGGMQRRLALGCALLHSPRVLFVDEPTAGLDPILRATIWEHLRHLASLGTTVFVTTQYLDEAVSCDRIALMRDGGLVALGTPDELRRKAIGGHALEIEAPFFDWRDAEALRELPGVHAITSSGIGPIRVVVDDVATATAQVSALLNERGTQVNRIEAHEPTFDEVFMALVAQAEHYDDDHEVKDR